MRASSAWAPLGLAICLASACPEAPRAATAPGAAVPPKPARAPLQMKAPTSASSLPDAGDFCVQVRSVNDATIAANVAQQMAAATNQVVEVQVRDLLDKGVWYRLCVGASNDPVALKAAVATSLNPGGALANLVDGSATELFVRQRQREQVVAPTTAAAASTTDALSPLALSGRVLRIGNMTAATAGATDGTTRVVVSQDDRRFEIEDGAPAGCAACELVLRATRLQQRVISIVPLSPSAPAVLVEEQGDAQTMLSLIALVGQRLVRLGGVSAEPVNNAATAAQLVEFDGDEATEVLVSVTPEASSCAGTYSILLNPSPDGLVRVLPSALFADLPMPSVDRLALPLLEALDTAEDHKMATRVCGRLSAQAQSSVVLSACLGRVRRLMADDHLVDALNAGAALLQAGPAASVIVPPLTTAAAALNKRAGFLQPLTCSARDANLTTVDDAFFVATDTLPRDAPLRRLSKDWLQVLKAHVPVRFAAIEALLQTAAAPSKDAP